MLIGVAALLWVTAGAYAGNYLRDKPNAGAFAVWWLMTLTGNFGAFLAADLAGFYLFFTLASLSAYGLIAFDRTAEAKRAAAIYVGLAVLGEALLLMAFVLIAAGVPSGSLLIGDAVASLATSPWRDYAMAFLILAFGLKIGLFPFHVWMPLTYSAAPIAAAAVLSGSAVKVGVIGLIRFLPFEFSDARLGWRIGHRRIVFGLLRRRHRNYASQSKDGPCLFKRESDGFARGCAWHGLVCRREQCRVGGSILRVVSRFGQRWSVPGYRCSCFDEAQRLVSPGTGSAGAGPWRASVDRRRAGEIGDEACHGRRDRGAAATLSAIGSTLLMLHFLRRMWSGSEQAEIAEAPALVWPWLATALAAAVLPWMLFSSVTNDSLRSALAPAEIWEALWPVLWAPSQAWRSGVGPVLPPRTPAGDLLAADKGLLRLASASGAAMEKIDGRLREWPLASALLLGLAIILSVSTFLGR